MVYLEKQSIGKKKEYFNFLKGYDQNNNFSGNCNNPSMFNYATLHEDIYVTLCVDSKRRNFINLFFQAWFTGIALF